MNFSIEIGPHTNLEALPPVKDVYITLLPGEDYVETAKRSVGEGGEETAAAAGGAYASCVCFLINKDFGDCVGVEADAPPACAPTFGDFFF